MSRKKKPTETASRANAPENFRKWWEPDEEAEQPSGASVGGHPDAHRVWARKDPGRWTRRIFGTTTDMAWRADSYRAEYYAWVEAGKPKGEPFISICASPERQVEWAKSLKATLSQIGKPMPKLTPKEVQAEARRMGQPHKMIEPLDENGAIDFDHRNNEE